MACGCQGWEQEQKGHSLEICEQCSAHLVPERAAGAAAKELCSGSSPHCDSPARCHTDGAQRLCNTEKSSSADVHGLGWARTMWGGLRGQEEQCRDAGSVAATGRGGGEKYLTLQYACHLSIQT